MGFSQILATQLQIPAVVFSPVGVRYSVQRFGIWPASLYQSITAVVPDEDIVPHFDEQMGSVQRVQCRNGATFAECHNLQRTECELFAVCGSVRSAHINAVCEAMFKDGWARTKQAVTMELHDWGRKHNPGEL